jgi:hypothetical protein
MERETAKGKFSKKYALLKALETVFGVVNAGIICEVEPPQKAAPVTEVKEESLPDAYAVGAQDTLKDVLEIFPNSELVDE